MTFYRTFCFAALLAIPQLMPAESIPPAALGQVEATVNFCAQADAKAADRYKEIGKSLVAGMSEKELAEARRSSEYKETYEAITTELQKMPADQAIESCRVSMPEEKQ